MSLRDYETFVYESCILNTPNPVKAWQQLNGKQQAIVDFLNTTSKIRYLEKTDITFSTKNEYGLI